jgi:hypothetical protein
MLLPHGQHLDSVLASRISNHCGLAAISAVFLLQHVVAAAAAAAMHPFGANTYMQQLLPFLRSSTREVVQHKPNGCIQSDKRQHATPATCWYTAARSIDVSHL